MLALDSRTQFLSTTTIRYLIVGITGGLLAVTVVMVALVFTLACYFSTSNIYWQVLHAVYHNIRTSLHTYSILAGG